ncbi:hypothetical protein EBX31_07115 [bacterium]|nr:hypothetical protein [bacterium]
MTYSVFSGQSIQAKIDGATNGDTVAIFGGTYTENLTIANKDVRLQLVAGQTVTLAGNITFSGLSNAYTFANFTWGGQTDKNITVSDCRNFTINGINSPAGNITVTGSNTAAKIFATALTNGTLTVSGGAKVQGIQSSNTGIAVSGSGTTTDFARCTVTGNVSVASGVSRVSFSRCLVTEILDSSAGNTYVSYTTLRVFRQRSSGKAYLLGNTINERSVPGIETVHAYENSTIIALNNIIRDGYHDDNYQDNWAFYADSAARIIAYNNIVYNYRGRYGDRAFGFVGSTTNIVSCNIAYQIQDEFASGPFANNTVTYNLSQTGESGGVFLQNRVNADPAFVDTTNFVLGPTSPARNAGDPDPRFNDIDGTRNDMGIYGGPLYDPEGRTGSKPVVMQVELDQTQFLRGDYSTLKLKAVGSATGTAP